jgi:hypothetical protein
MQNLIIRHLDAFDRVVEFGANHPLTTPIAAVTTLYTGVGNVATAIRGHQGDQESGRGEFLGGSSTRALMAERLLKQMRPINRIARSLNREQYPGVREKFFMPRLGGFEGIIGRAEAFIDAIAPIKSAFTDRGMPATFDAELEAAKDALVAAAGDKNAGLATQVGGTAGFLVKSREGLLLMRELDAILSHQYRDNPVLLAAWKSACHVERDPESEKTAGSGGGATASTAPSPAPAPGA